MRSILVLCVCLFSAVHAATVPAPAPPSFDAKSYILLDYQSGEALAERNADERLAPASITKLMTAYVVFKALAEGQASMDDEVYVSEKAWRMEGSRMFIEVGKRVRLADLLKGMIIQSGNDACVALAEHLAGSEAVFASMLKAGAEALGMHNSHFVNVTGLPDPEHYMSARDIALLARALIRDFPDQYWHYSQKKFTYNNITQYNRNKLLWRDDSVDGLKTGHTESAGYCLVSSAKRDDMRLISAVMGTKGPKARARHSEALLNYGFRFFETHRLYAAGEALIDPRVWMGEPETVPMGLKADLYVTIPRGQYDNLDARIELDSQITAPVHDGQTLGKVVVAFNGEELTQTPLVALQEVPEGGLWRQAVDLVLQWWD
jgi:D-alanyl-D-alanine carboxypeptidase (penicillin-binding protein 5/6)